MLTSSRSVLASPCRGGRLSGAVAAVPGAQTPSTPPPAGIDKGLESHLHNVKQLTFGGENAEAYFSADGTRLIFQSTRAGYGCDQIYTMKVDGSDERRVSNGTGRTTCGYYYPGGKQILYASTHAASPECPPRPSYARGYVWPIYDGYDIFRANADGSAPTPLTQTPGYDAEATIAPDGLIVFTSVRDGDMEIYSMKADGSDVRRLTNRPGPDGGPFFSWDGKQVAFRGRMLGAGAELDEYRSLLKEGLWRPTSLELFVMNRDGSNLQAGDQARRRQLRAVLASRRQAPDLRVEHQRSQGPQLRSLPGQPRRERPRAAHVQRDLRRVPDVLARRQEAGVRLEPEGEVGGGDERLHCGLGGIGGRSGRPKYAWPTLNHHAAKALTRFAEVQ